MVHPHTEPARKLLEAEGLSYQGFVDIFDGGPTLEAELSKLRVMRESKCLRAVCGQPPAEGVLCLVSNTNYLNYRAVLSTFTPEADTVALTEADCDALGIGEGDQVHIVALNSRETL